MLKFRYILATVIIFASVTILIPDSFAQSYTGVLTLNSIPSQVNSGDEITFSGRLVTTSGHTVPNALVYIKDDVFWGPDTVIKRIFTDDDGYFVTTLKSKVRSSGDWDFYAVFEGNSHVSKARSNTYNVNVSSYSGSSSSISSTTITLDRIPSQIFAGQSFTFTGRVTSNGQPLPSVLVKIMEDDPLSPDQRLGIERTNSDGRFSIPWHVSAGYFETDFDIYAVFDGDSSYKRARSLNQIMSVLKYAGSIVLDPLPASARVGEAIIFSGSLNFDQGSERGAIVYIKDEDPLDRDDLLATAYVDGSGRFSANWFVTDVDTDSVADIYAVFEGNAEFYRLTTCDRVATLGFGGTCKYTIPLKITTLSAPSPGPSTGPGPDYEYIEVYYSIPLTRNPHVVISPSPDSYDVAKQYVGSIKKGIQIWEYDLERKFGGTWDVTFEVTSPRDPFFKNKPDIVVNIVTPDEDTKCLSEYAGWSEVWKTPPDTIQTQVCTSSDDIHRTAAHEFIHAMGLGHAFNKKGDMMCSFEYDNGKKFKTCPDLNSRSNRPSDLNLEAVEHLYNSDGFKNPNKSVLYKSKFVAGDSQSSGTSVSKSSLDSDGDGIDDRIDFCDYQKETFNGYLDSDGCPDTEPKTQSASDDCMSANHDYPIIDLLLESSYSMSYNLLRDGQIVYCFSTDNEYEGFMIYILTPETDVADFINYGDGYYYECEEYGITWLTKSNTCNIASGSTFVLYNDGPNAIRINGWIE